MLPDEHVKEHLHRAYVQAVAAQAGFTCDFPQADYGVDARISQVRKMPRGRYRASGTHFNVQMKASHQFTRRANDTGYSLEAEAYNSLVDHDDSPIILLVFCTPRLAVDRLDLGLDFLALQHCCLWFPRPTIPTLNSSSVNLSLPHTQLFTVDECRRVMDLAKARKL
jgi:hypothetical protein